jgi:DNA-binding PadR family transcriptional regulator
VKKPSPEEIQSLLPMAPVVFEILLALAEGERHGYAIKREVALRTNGKYRLGPGTLYGAIKRMLAQGLIAESDVRPDAHLDDERRHYYRLTPLGTCAARAELDRMRDILLVSSSKPLLARIVKDH